MVLPFPAAILGFGIESNDLVRMSPILPFVAEAQRVLGISQEVGRAAKDGVYHLKEFEG